MSVCREDIAERLRAYRGTQNQIAILKYESEHPGIVTAGEVIAGMALRPPIGCDVPVCSSKNGDKTEAVAENYGKQLVRLNDECSSQIANELTAMVCESSRLETYVGLLPDNLATLIRLHYFEGVIWREVEKRVGLSKRSVAINHNKALDKLAMMFNLVENARTGQRTQTTLM